MHEIYPINHYPALDFRDDEQDKERIIIILKDVIGDSSQPTGQFVDPSGDRWMIGTIARDRNYQRQFVVDENYLSPPFIHNTNKFYETAKDAKEAVIATHRLHRKQRAEVGGEDFEIVIYRPAASGVLRVTSAGEHSEDEQYKVFIFSNHAAAESLCETLNKESYDSRPAAGYNRPTYLVCIRDIAGDTDIRPFADRPPPFSSGFNKA